MVRARGVTVGYLPQQPELEPARPPWKPRWTGNRAWRRSKPSWNRWKPAWATRQSIRIRRSSQRALARQQALLDEYEALGGESYPGRVRELLLGLGLPDGDLDKPLGLLSGGQKKLVGLARLLLLRPSVLLLDEPDNHLDLPGKALPGTADPRISRARW